MTIKKSTDSGQSWQVATPIFSGPSAYSVMVTIDESRVGVVYERGETDAYERITMAVVDVAKA